MGASIDISIIHKKERGIRTCFPLSILLSAHLSVLVRFPIPMNVLAIC